MPDWLIPALVQYPVVAIVGLVAWYAYRELKRTNAEHLETERKLREELLLKLRESQKATVAGVRAEMTNLRKQVGGKLDELIGKVDGLSRGPNP